MRKSSKKREEKRKKVIEAEQSNVIVDLKKYPCRKKIPLKKQAGWKALTTTRDLRHLGQLFTLKWKYVSPTAMKALSFGLCFHSCSLVRRAIVS